MKIDPVGASAPALKPPSTPTLPAPVDGFVGTTEEIARARAALLAGRRGGDTIRQTCAVKGTSLDSPVCADGRVFASRWQQKTVSALNSDTGATIWEHDIGEATTPPYVSSHGLVFVGGGDHMLHGYDPATGDERWSLPLDVAGRLMEDAQGNLYACTSHGVIAIDVANKKVLWSTGLPHSCAGGVVVGRDGFIYGGSGNTLYKMAPETGAEVWHYDTASMIRTRPAVDDRGVSYIGNIKGNLVAVSPNGAPKWSFPTGGFILTPAVLSHDGAVYVGSCDRSVYRINRETGRQDWKFDTNAELRASPTPSLDGMVYAVSDRNQVFGLDAASGKPRWDFKADSYVHNPIAADGQGRIFYGCNNFTLCGHENPAMRSRVAEAQLNPPDAPPKAIHEEDDDGWLVIGDLRLKPPA